MSRVSFQCLTSFTFSLSTLSFSHNSRSFLCFSLRASSTRAMASHIVGYPRMGPKRELKFALESFWDGKSSAEELKKVSADLRLAIWKQMAEAGIQYIPSTPSHTMIKYWTQQPCLGQEEMHLYQLWK